jgi:hypothetical protein
MDFPTIKDSQYFNDYYEILEKNTEKLIILQSNPRVTAPQDCVMANYTYSRDCVAIENTFHIEYAETLKEIRSLASSKTFVVEAQKWICVNLECPITSGGLFVTRDGSHPAYSYVKKISPLIRGKIHEIIQKK